MTTAVRVFVNNHPVEVYPGASVRHALLRYSETVYQDAVAGKLVVTDRHGNRLGLGGALEEGLRLTVEGPGGYRPGPARRPGAQEVADAAGQEVDGKPRAAAANGLVVTEARPGGRAPGGGPAAGATGAAEAAASANGVHPAGRGDGRRRRRGRRRGRRGRPRAHPEAGKGGRAAGGQANGTA